MAKDLNKMSLEELEERAASLADDLTAANNALDEVRTKARDKVLKIHQEYDEVAAVLGAKRTLERLSDTEKAALAQMVEANGIKSGEKVGTPGAE